MISSGLKREIRGLVTCFKERSIKMVTTVRVNSMKKVRRIVNELKKNNRFAIYEEFYTYDNKYYLVYYKVI